MTRLVSLALAVLAFPALVRAQARQFDVTDDGGSRMQFVSDAPLETITGVTTALTGNFTFDPAHLAATRGRIAARVASIRTGIDLRDTHLASDHWLDAARFPNATFEITSVTGPASVAAGQAVDLQVRGHFSIHGQTKDITATVRIRYMPLTPEMTAGGNVNADVVRVHASFTVRLTDFGISVPDVIRLKVSDDIQVNVDLRAVVHAAPAAAPAHPPTAPASSSATPPTGSGAAHSKE